VPRQIKPADTEKITINLGYVDLGRIDLLVEEGFYTNRTDFIRAAIRTQLGGHTAEVGRLIERRTLDVGLRDFHAADLEAARAAGQMLHIKVVGLARLADDVTARTRAGNHRLDQRPRRAAGVSRGSGRTGRPHHLRASARPKRKKMNDDFATALRRSLEQTRAGNPMEATRLIQGALGAGPGARASGAPPEDTTVERERRPHRHLSEVLAGLARRPPGLDLPKGRRRHIVEVPDGADFARRRHECRHGARDYRLYSPSSRSEGVEGLILMLHGCTQSPEDFAVGTGMNAAAERNRMMVVYPEQERTHNASLCWNWFRPGDQGPSAGEAALLASLAAAVVAEHRLPPERVFVAGLSAGGAMAAILAHSRPDVFRAAGVHFRSRARIGAGCRVRLRRHARRPGARCRGDPGAGNHLPGISGHHRRAGQRRSPCRTARGNGPAVGSGAGAPLRRPVRPERGRPAGRGLADRGGRPRLVGRQAWRQSH
jgi:Arc/MetJ-type ribon-helix-helix transcriptional regulator